MASKELKISAENAWADFLGFFIGSSFVKSENLEISEV